MTEQNESREREREDSQSNRNKLEYPQTMAEPSSPIEHRAYARVGFLGNPSDVYFGRAISFSVANFFASVHLQPSDDLVIRPHRTHDLANFRSLVHLVCPPIFLKPPEVWNSWRRNGSDLMRSRSVRNCRLVGWRTKATMEA